MYACQKTTFAFAVLLMALLAACANADESCKNTYKCTDMPKCSGEETGAWGSDGKMCYVFVNACQRYAENCQRENRCLEHLKDITKDECEKLCLNDCAAADKPVCGYFAGKPQTFTNECELGKLGCQKNQAWKLVSVGKC